MRHLIWLALVLIAFYLVLSIGKFVVGGALHLLWIAAIIVFLIWLVGVIRGRGPRVP